MSEDLLQNPEVMMLIKSRIKQHTRKTKSGKIATVREHEDIRTKKADAAKKNRGKNEKAEPKNSPAKIGKMLASRGVPISQNGNGKATSGIAIRQSNNGKNMVMEYKDWENKGDRHTVMNGVRNQLKAVGLDISVKDGTEKYYIHTAGANFFGHGDFPDDTPKPKGSKESRAAMRESTAGIMDMLDSTHNKQAEESKKAEADIAQEEPKKDAPKKGGDVGGLEAEAKKYKSAEEFIKAKQKDIVYHGSPTPLEKFDDSGAFFTDDMNNADGYAGGENVYEGFLDLKNPLIIDAKGRHHSDLKTKYGKTTQEVVGNADSKKYDGVIFNNVNDSFADDVGGKGTDNIFYPFNANEAFKNESQLTDIWNKANGGDGVKSIMTSWEKQGIKSWITEKGDAITLSEISLPKEKRGQGIGTKAMKELTDYADSKGQKIVLTPSKDYGATSVKRLESFYKQAGFKSNKGRNKDFKFKDTMIRLPAKKMAKSFLGLPTQIAKKSHTKIGNLGNGEFGLATQIPKMRLPAKLSKSRKGSQKPGHKYIERKGTPGDYDYKYKEPEQHSIFDKPKAKITETKVLDLTLITPDPGQPREDFNEADLLTLGGSIRDLGLIQEIAVRPDPADKTKYIIIAGERRYRASKLVGLNTIRSRIYNIQDPQAIYAIQVAENVGRKEMNPIETARAFKRLFDAGVPIESIALKVGTSPLTVKRKMMLITLTDAIQNLVKHGNLPLNQAYIIAMAELRPEFQNNVMRRLNAGKISSEALMGLVGKYKKAQTQTSMFGGSEKTTLADAINGTRLKKLERDTVKLIEDIGKTLNSITKDGGSKILPAIAKEKGKLAVVAKKLDMATSEMIKLNRDMKRAQEYFNSGGTVSQYIKDKKLAKKKARKLKKSIIELVAMFEPQLPKLIKLKRGDIK